MKYYKFQLFSFIRTLGMYCTVFTFAGWLAQALVSDFWLLWMENCDLKTGYILCRGSVQSFTELGI